MRKHLKTPITKERLLSIGSLPSLNKDVFSLLITDGLYIEIDISTGLIMICDYCVDITLERKFKTMEDIKQLITGLTGKKL